MHYYVKNRLLLILHSQFFVFALCAVGDREGTKIMFNVCVFVCVCVCVGGGGLKFCLEKTTTVNFKDSNTDGPFAEVSNSFLSP